MLNFIEVYFFFGDPPTLEQNITKSLLSLQCECRHQRDFATLFDRFALRRLKPKSGLLSIASVPTFDQHSAKKIPYGDVETLPNSSIFTCWDIRRTLASSSV